jgi:DNA-binding HxlR family transcriptional regulator
MSQKNYLNHNCPIAQAMAILGGQWTLLIARDLMKGINKFDNIQKSLNISRNLLTQRLQQMESNGLTQKVVPDGLKRSIYKPTKKCFDLINTLLALSEWSEKWIPDPKGPRIKVTSPKTGESLRLALLPSKQAQKYSNDSLDITYNTDLKQKMNLQKAVNSS